MENQAPPVDPAHPSNNHVYTAPHIDNPPPKKSFLKLIVLLFIIFIIFVGGATNYVAFKDKFNPAPIAPKPTSAPTPTPADKTATWKTYENPTYDFSLKYPPSWSSEENPNPINFVSSDLLRASNDRISYVQKGAQVSIYFTSIPTIGDIRKDFDGYFRAGGESVNVIETGQSSVSGIPSINYSYKLIDNHTVRGTFLILNNKLVTISLISELNKENELTATFNQILTTLKFTEQNISPVACTEEAKICPDGSAVGRQGPQCEFAACPGE